MKIKMYDKDYIMIRPARIESKEHAKYIADPMTGMKGDALTYEVLDCNGHKDLDKKIIGIHRHNVFSFENMSIKYEFCNHKAVVFIAELEAGEMIMDKKDASAPAVVNKKPGVIIT